jgi:hypothetical protein
VASQEAPQTAPPVATQTPPAETAPPGPPAAKSEPAPAPAKPAAEAETKPPPAVASAPPLAAPPAPAPQPTVAPAPVVQAPVTPAPAPAPVPPAAVAQTPPAPTPAPAPQVSTPAPPPSPAEKPAPPAEMAGIVPPNPAAIREALAALALSANCAVPRFSLGDDGGVSATGFVGAGAPSTALRGAVEAAVGGAQLSWLMVPVDGPYCPAFNLVRPIAQASSPAFGLTLKDDVTRLKDNDPIRPILKLPDFPAYLQVDYLSHDGSVAHLVSSQGGKAKAYPAGTTLALGDPKLGVGAVGPPFGTDVILAVASSTPLWAKPRPAETETAQDYLPALQAALDAARERNAKLTGRALVLETVPR